MKIFFKPKSRKIFSFFLLFLFLTNSFPIKVNAVNIYSEVELKQIAYSNINKITKRVTGYSTQKSVFNNLRNIMISALWVQFMYTNDSADQTKKVNFSEDELKFYYTSFKSKIDDFNEGAKDGKDYIKAVLPTAPDTFSKDYFTTITNYITSYMNSYFSKVKAEYDSKKDSEKEKYLQDNTLTILGGYEVLLRTSQEYDFMKSVSITENSLVNFDEQVAMISSLMSNPDFQFAYEVAIKQIEKGVNVGSAIELTNRDDLIGKFTEQGEDGQLTNKVNKAYLAVIASSAIYKPMESRLGEDEFIESLKFLVGENSDIIQAYSDVAYYKKPLYYVDYNINYSEGELKRDPKYFKSNAKRATLGTLVELIREKKDGALITMKGTFEPSTEDSVYVSSQKNNVGLADNGDNVGDYVDPNTGETLGQSTEKEDKENKEAGADNSNIPNTNKEDEKKDDKKKDDAKVENKSNGANSTEKLYDATQGNKEVALGNEISDTTFFTEPFLMFSKSGLPGINFLMLNNIFAESNGKVNIDDTKIYNTSLYINPFGDIVTSDNLVVVPASANATYYSLDPTIIYNPFTDTFMDNYPSIASSKKFKISSKDEGKLILGIPEGRMSDIDKLKERYSIRYDSLNDITAYYVKGENDSSGLRSVFRNDINPIDVGIYDPVSGEKYNVFSPQPKEFNWYNFTGKLNQKNNNFYTIDTNILTSSGVTVPLYPYTNATGEEAKVRNRFIVQSFYSGLVMDSEGAEGNSDNGRFDTQYMKYVLTEALNGKISVVGYEKGIYNDLANTRNSSKFAWLVDVFTWVSDNIVKLFGSAPGTLGLRPATQDGLMGRLLYYSMTAFPFLALILIVVMMALYTKDRLNILASIAYTGVCVAGLYILIYLAPKYLADITNFLPNNGSNKLAFDSLLLRQEVFTEKNNIQATYSNFGKFGFAESSITLYALTDEQLEEICKLYGQEVQTIMSGGSFVIDENSGLFVQGYKIKMSLDKFLDGISVEVKIDNKSNVGIYQLEKKEYVESVMNYYTPYSVIMDGLIEKLNKLSKVYLLSRNQLPYPNGVRKDAFFMDSYVSSPIFTSPTDPKNDDPEMSDDTLRLLSQYFGEGDEIDNIDFLGLTESLGKYLTTEGSGAQDTLWYQTMEQNAYFSEQAGNKLMSNLILYVNQNTKEWLLDNIDKLKYISDETLIETTSLYATMLFNTQVSQFYNKMYPERINYEELSVIDTLRPILTKDYNRFSSVSRDLVEYVYYEYGFFGNLALGMIVLMQGITSLILTYAIFIMYMLLILFILIRLIIKRESVKSAIMGFAKLYSVLVGVYYVNVLFMQLLNNFDSSGITLFFALLLSTVVSGMSTSVVFYTITGFSTLDFANERSFKGLFKVLDKMSFGMLQGAVDAVSSRVGSIMSNSFSTRDRSDAINKKVSLMDLQYSRYADSAAIDNYINDRYSQYEGVETTEDFYRRKDFKFRRANRMKRIIEIDVEDDGDFLA